MIKNAKRACYIVFLLFVSFSISCAPGTRLNTQGVPPQEVTGTYRVIFYGCNFMNDLETIVIFDKEDDNYFFDPYAPEFKYREKKAMDSAAAFAEAEDFLRCNASFSSIQLRQITGPDGVVVGYELRPLYFPYGYGVQDVLDTNYFLKADKVVAVIRLIPSVERMIHGGGVIDRESF